jgi:hypothetical protein
MLRKSLSRFIGALGLGFLVAVTALAAGSAQAKNDKQPNILLIMGDDIGWENLGAYHQGLLLDATPNLDKLASEGMRFTDYYAEASCTAGRAWSNRAPAICGRATRPG